MLHAGAGRDGLPAGRFQERQDNASPEEYKARQEKIEAQEKSYREAEGQSKAEDKRQQEREAKRKEAEDFRRKQQEKVQKEAEEKTKKTESGQL